MAQLGASYPGLSGHIHLSLVARDGGANAFADGTAETGLSATCRSFIAGVVELAPHALALCAHTVNAYRRLTPGNWAPQTASWAVQNYGAAIRAVAAPESKCRLEFRLPASDTNPYLALAMMLGAGLDGIAREAEPPPPMAGTGTGEASAPGMADAIPLPHDLFEATERLAASRRAREIFGDVFIDHFVMSRRAEEIALRRQVSAAERARYLESV
jgi:glutamine synthetase